MSRPEEEEVLFAYVAEVRYLPLEKAFGSGACYTKAPSLVPSSHSCGSNPTSPLIPTLES